jgi:predicted RNA binding protein YcfA (HicA-like mRNA interferase family)
LRRHVNAVRIGSIGTRTVVPFHAGRDVSPTLLRKIAKDIGLTVEQLLKPR